MHILPFWSGGGNVTKEIWGHLHEKFEFPEGKNDFMDKIGGKKGFGG